MAAYNLQVTRRNILTHPKLFLVFLLSIRNMQTKEENISVQIFM